MTPAQGAHKWADKQIKAYVEWMAVSANVMAGKHQGAVVAADSADNKILACAEEEQVDSIVASAKRYLLPLGSYAEIPIVSLRDFFEYA